MTHDTDEHNNVPYKITISSENVTDDHIKQHFEKGLSALLADPYFLLLYVPENGAKMQIIQPAKDSYHQKRIEKKISEAKGIPSFYYALSHLWKITENNRHLWEEIGEYVNDLDGKPAAPVSMRREKRDTLLGLLKDHPDSYWWIDVLCARTDTPLDIMGNIYSCCHECIAMVDFEPKLLSKLHTEKNMRKGIFDKDFWNTYKNGISNSDYVLYCKQIYEKYTELFVGAGGLVGFSDLVECLYAFRQIEWWNRVWTWQEVVLPFGIVRFMAETDIERLQSNTITMDDLLNSFKNASYIILYMRLKNDADPELERFLFSWFFEICSPRDVRKNSRVVMPANNFCALISSLGKSSRRCMDPVDYVYGVLGALQIKIPRMTDPKKVWQRFLSELDDYMDTANIRNKHVHNVAGTISKIVGIHEDAHRIDLTAAECMGDVYSEVLDYEHVK